MKLKTSYIKKIIREEIDSNLPDSNRWRDFWLNGPGGQFVDSDDTTRRIVELFVQDLRKMTAHADAVIEKSEWSSGPDNAAFFRMREFMRSKWFGKTGILSTNMPPRSSEFLQNYKDWGLPSWGESRSAAQWAQTDFFHNWLGE